MESLLSSIPFMDIPCMYLPPIFVHLPMQVYCMQCCIGINKSTLPAPTLTVKGYYPGGVSLLCRSTQVARLPSTYPSLQRKRQDGGLSLPHITAT